MTMLVTGATGLLGRTIRDHYDPSIHGEVAWFSSKDCDLRNRMDVGRMFRWVKPTKVLHLAARVGGIIANSSQQYDFFMDNLTINTNIIDECINNNCKAFMVSSSCAYPKSAATYPMDENVLHSGPAEPTDFGYAYAKRMMDVQLDAAKSQFGYDSCTFYLGNLYGKYDHFLDPFNSHLVPALVAKFHFAKKSGAPSVELYGDGTPLRQFTLTDDVAKIILDMIHKDACGKFNIASPENMSVRDIASIVANVVGYNGEILYNGSLNGVHRKDIDCGRIMQYGDYTFTGLRDGIESVYSQVKTSLFKEVSA